MRRKDEILDEANATDAEFLPILVISALVDIRDTLVETNRNLDFMARALKDGLPR